MKTKKVWTTEEVDYLKAHYATTAVKDIAQTLGRTRVSIQGMVAWYGLKNRRTLATEAICHRYFEQVATHDQAYILGLLTADGSVGETGSIRLLLHKKDGEAVVFVRDRIAPLSPLYTYRHFVSVGITSTIMAEHLKHWGVIPRKSYAGVWPQALPEDLIAPFLLGYFDGDGSLSIVQGKHRAPRHEWSLYGQQQFLHAAASVIEQCIGLKLAEPSKDPRKFASYRLRAYCANAVILDKWLHASGLGMSRKKIP